MPQQISDILWGTNDGDDDLSNVEMLSTYEESDFKYDKSDDNIVDEQPQPSTSQDFCCTCPRCLPTSCFASSSVGQFTPKVLCFDQSNTGIRENCGKENCEYKYFSAQLMRQL